MPMNRNFLHPVTEIALSLPAQTKFRALLSRQSARVHTVTLLREAASIAVREVSLFLRENSFLQKVVFACFSESDLDVYKGAVEMSG
jgi:O-acetyl-ADP-ribose deacetylase (regulator of RNase III)